MQGKILFLRSKSLTLNKIRLQKHLSQLNILSRRKAEEAIQKGLIKINGQTATIGQLVDPESDKIELDPSLQNKTYTTLLFHKPRGIVTNCPQQGEKEIKDLLPNELKHLSSIGRLDKDSEGLILFTDDGILAKSYLTPTTPHTRVYEVWIGLPLQPSQKQTLEKGIPLFGKITAPLSITCLSPTHLQWSMTEGKNRQIRRMLREVGHTVKRLKRIKFGPYSLENLQPNSYKII